jgi:alkylation response protein AidB-like acyl-CoA dehydrogenase
MLDLLSHLLREPPAPVQADDVAAWWRACGALTRPSPPIDRAVAAGFAADRVAGAFTAGYQAALRSLLARASLSLPDDVIASFCATEEGGNQPRAIRTSLAPAPGGALALTGAKRWSTMAPLASVLLVVASEGTDAAGRNRLRLVRVEASSPGVTIAAMPPTAFVPEVPHGVIELDRVLVEPGALLPGDGYDRYVKPFRTVEDLHIHGALLGYLLSVARRHGAPEALVERLVASVAATHALAHLDPAAAEVHLALAGLLAQDARLIDDVSAVWERAPAERERWERDRARFGSVAGQLRELRRQRAWDAVGGGPR